jgi:arabinofuranosyltransferase
MMRYAGLLQRLEAQPQWLLSGLIAIALLQLWPYRHFSGDDAYISFRFAENFAEGLGFSFNPGEPTYGSTSPLWVLLLAALHRAGASVADASHALNWTCAALNIIVFWRLCLRYFSSALPAAAAVLLLAFDPWYVRWSMSGMENGLALLLLMSAFLNQLRLLNCGRLNWLSPMLAALATLCRPEMALLALLLVADTILHERRRRLGNILAVAAAYTVVLLPWLLYAHSAFGTIIPNSIAAKLSKDHLDALIRIAKYFGSFWIFQALALVVLVGFIDRRLLLRALRPWTWGRWTLPIAWGLALPAFYILGGAPVSARYMMYGLPCYLLVGVKAWSLLAGKHRAWVGVSFAATLTLIGFVQYRYCYYVTEWPAGMDPQMIEVAQTLRSISGENDVVACDQIGVIGYFSRRRILDMYGLVSPEVMPYRRSADPNAPWHFVHARAPAYVFLGEDLPTLVARDPAYGSLTLVMQRAIQREGASAALKPTIYYLYRTNWNSSAGAQSQDGVAVGAR